MAKFKISFLFIFLFLKSYHSISQDSSKKKFDKIIFGCSTSDITDFENFVIKAKKSGATHINLSNEDLPLAKWEYDTDNDPYPSWVFTNLGLLKIATPKILKPYIPQDYADNVLNLLEERCKVLRKYGMKASLKTFEPQMLPEKVFTDHPLWRGPRVDHPSRSRVARWAPDIDNQEVLQLYSEALTILLKRCPEIDILSLTTNDSGTGFSWSNGLYSGATGNTFNKNRRMDERIFNFFTVLRKAANDAGSNLEIDVFNTREEFPEKIALALSPGMAIENLEGPNGQPFKSEVGFVMDYYQVLYPVVGIPDPSGFIDQLANAHNNNSKRIFVLIGDKFNRDLYFSIYDKFNVKPSTDLLGKLILLKEIAKEKLGDNAGEELFKLWHLLSEARKLLYLTDNGGYIFYLGAVQQRWLTRPFVPYPQELKREDKDYYRKYQFQAKTEDEANDMANLQASRVFSGGSGSFFVSKIMGNSKNILQQAIQTAGKVLKFQLDEKQEKEFQLLSLRLQALILVCNNAQNAISYQAQLDKAKAEHSELITVSDLGKPSTWERTRMLETARKEIDNTAMLLSLLESTNEKILDIAPSNEQEDIRRFGPEFKNQLKHKLKIMNEHWLDYNRIFQIPNL